MPVPVHGVRVPCGAPVITVWHVPRLLMLSGMSHAWHWPLHAELQQTPSTQCMLEHCASAVQLRPLPSRPHDMLTQVLEPEHCVESAQGGPKHCVASLHLYGAQSCIA